MARRPLIDRLPQVHRELDIDGVLSRFLGVVDTSIDNAMAKAEALYALRDVREIPDKYLGFLGDLVGHVWRYDKSSPWNRHRIRSAINRYSYKGTDLAKQDIITEYGGIPLAITDMASKLLVLGKQGRLGRSDCTLIDNNLNHDGSFVFEIDHRVDTQAFYNEFATQRPVGYLYWFSIQEPLYLELDSVWYSGEYSVEYVTNTTEGVLGRTLINDLPLPYYATGWFDLQEHDIDWQLITNESEGTIGITALGNELVLGGVYQGTTSILNGECDSFVGQASGYLWTDSLVYVSDAVTTTKLVSGEMEGRQSGFEVTEVSEV